MFHYYRVHNLTRALDMIMNQYKAFAYRTSMIGNPKLIGISFDYKFLRCREFDNKKITDGREIMCQWLNSSRGSTRTCTKRIINSYAQHRPFFFQLTARHVARVPTNIFFFFSFCPSFISLGDSSISSFDDFSRMMEKLLNVMCDLMWKPVIFFHRHTRWRVGLRYSTTLFQ